MKEIRIFYLKNEEMTPEELEEALDVRLLKSNFTHVQLRNGRFYLEDGTLIAVLTPNEGEIAIPTELCDDEDNEAIMHSIKKLAEASDRVFDIPI